MSASNAYPVPPPSYSSAPSIKKPAYGATAGSSDQAASEPLLAGEGEAARNAWSEEDELEGDFKVRAIADEELVRGS